MGERSFGSVARGAQAQKPTESVDWRMPMLEEYQMKKNAIFGVDERTNDGIKI